MRWSKRIGPSGERQKGLTALEVMGGRGEDGMQNLTARIRNLGLLFNPDLLLRGYSSYMFTSPNFLLIKLQDLWSAWFI